MAAMATRRTTDAIERIDMQIVAMEQFLALDLVADAIRRCRSALAQCDAEARATLDPVEHAGIAQRRMYLVDVMARLGVRPAPDRGAHAIL